MGNAINLQSVFITDLVGIAILVIILAAKGWNLPARKDESRIIVSLLLVSILNCIADIYVFYFDGKPGQLYFLILIIGNTYLYLYNLIVGIGIIYLIIKHILHVVTFWQIVNLHVVVLHVFFKPYDVILTP